MFNYGGRGNRAIEEQLRLAEVNRHAMSEVEQTVQGLKKMRLALQR